MLLKHFHDENKPRLMNLERVMSNLSCTKTSSARIDLLIELILIAIAQTSFICFPPRALIKARNKTDRLYTANC
jgi:hypothetical protein